MDKSGFKRIVLLLVVSASFFSLRAQNDSLRSDSLRRLRLEASKPDSILLAAKLETDTLKPEFLLHLPDSGIASWYGSNRNGHLTASGEKFHADSMTCAHRTLPFGTLLRVTNLKNDSVVWVKVNDRLPKSSKRMIDLSSGAARKLNFLRAGLTRVRLEYAGTAPLNPARKRRA